MKLKNSISIDHIHGLPIIAKTASYVLALLARKKMNLESLNHLIKNDPTLTMLILRSVFSLSKEASFNINCTSEAMVILHPSDMSQLIKNNIFISSTPQPIPTEPITKLSTSIAKIARSLADMLFLPSQLIYTCALLSMIGEVALYMRHPTLMLKMDAKFNLNTISRLQVQNEHLGTNYAEVTSNLLEHWGFPTRITNPIRYMSDPLGHVSNDTNGAEIAALIHLANWRARSRAMQFNDHHLVVSFPHDIASALGLDLDTVLKQDPINWKKYPRQKWL